MTRMVTVDGLLGCCVRVHSGHQALNDAKLVVDHLHKGCKTVGGARGVGHNVVPVAVHAIRND